MNNCKIKFQNISYSIFIIEQLGNDPFNRGKLLNIGTIEVIKEELRKQNLFSGKNFKVLSFKQKNDFLGFNKEVSKETHR
jgi:hypothetical protein